MRFGIIGLGKISDRIAKGIECSEYGTLYAVASRSYEKALAFRERHHAEIAYGSYEELLNDPNVDIVYIATINQNHYELIKMCADHGKNIICEKPLVKDYEETKEIYAYAKLKRVFLMEAQKACFTNLTRKIRSIISDGVIGKIESIKASYCMNADYGSDHWVMDKVYGGVMKDIGVYPLAYANLIADAKIRDVDITSVKREKGTDVRVELKVKYANNVIAYLMASFRDEMTNYAVIKGTRGTIIVENFWKNNKATLTVGRNMINIEVEQESEFQAEIDHACMCIMNGFKKSLVYGREASIKVAEIVDMVKNIQS